jgi:hypothetical protein
VALAIDDPARPGVTHDHALVEAALIDTPFVGARAVGDPTSIRWVVACIANPASTGVASIAGRVHPVDRNDSGGVLIRLGPGGRRVRVPLAPGTFATLEVASVEPLAPSQSIQLTGGGVLAYDGERTTPVSADARLTVSIERSGPRVIDVDMALAIAARDRRFDAAPDDDGRRSGPAGDPPRSPARTPPRKDTHGD